MKSIAALTAAAALAALAACAEQEPSRADNEAAAFEEKADDLDNAAEVSHPAGRPILENAAEDMRNQADAIEDGAEENEEAEAE